VVGTKMTRARKPKPEMDSSANSAPTFNAISKPNFGSVLAPVLETVFDVDHAPHVPPIQTITNSLRVIVRNTKTQSVKRPRYVLTVSLNSRSRLWETTPNLSLIECAAPTMNAQRTSSKSLLQPTVSIDCAETFRTVVSTTDSDTRSHLALAPVMRLASSPRSVTQPTLGSTSAKLSHSPLTESAPILPHAMCRRSTNRHGSQPLRVVSVPR